MEWECCWNRAVIAPGECPHIQEDDTELLVAHERRILEKCCDCEMFLRDLKQFGESQHPLAAVVTLLHGDYQRKKNQIQSLASFLDTQTLQVRFLHELGSVLQSSVDLDEVLSVALTAITAGKGFGMNRAFLLLLNKERTVLVGHLAIGPRHMEEAWQVWEEISCNDMDLKTLAHNFRTNKLSAERAKFHDILEQMTIEVSRTDHILVKALSSKHTILIENAFHHPDVDPGFAALLGIDTFLLMPLVFHNRHIGVIIADNCITHRPITLNDMRSLETFSFPVAFAIERASLYDRLQVELSRVTEANTKLREQQELIVRMEKMALVGRITSSVAHSIRNPLMVIGGFARSMLKSTPEVDPKRTYIESIVTETAQIESVLDEILNYSDSLFPARDFWDINQVVESAIRDVQEMLLQKNGVCLFTPEPSLPLVYVDIKLISYCLRSLIISDCEGRENETVTIAAHLRDNYIQLTIADSGRVVTQEELEMLLTPFSMTYDMRGGLGLSLCRSMLERQGIPLIVVAPPEGGLTYTMTLPTIKEEQHEKTTDS